MNNLLELTITRRTGLSKVVKEWTKLAQPQENNLHRALLGEGKFSLKSMYKYLEIPKHDFFKLTKKERKKSLSKVHKAYTHVSQPAMVRRDAPEHAVNLTS